MKNNKIFIGVCEVAGMGARLHKAFDKLGYENSYVCLQLYKYDKAETYNNCNIEILKKYFIYFEKAKLSKEKSIRKLFYVAKYSACLIHLFLYAIRNYDSFLYLYHYNILGCIPYFSGILYKLEFLILKIFKKKVIVWYCGSDSRAAYVDYSSKDLKKIEKRQIERKAKTVQFVEKNAIVIDNPASSHFHKEKFIIFQFLGIPIDEEEVRVQKDFAREKVTIFHAPSHIEAKGTQRIRKIIENIIEKGYDIKYIEKSDVSHKEILDNLAKADIVIDEMYSDTPMAGLGTEAAINGVPVITGGYFAPMCKKILKEYYAPTIFCIPEEMEEKVIELINDKGKRERIGKEERDFAVRNYDSEVVAENVIRAFNNLLPSSWYYDPYDSEYIWGSGVSREKVKENIMYIYKKYGMEGLGIIDKKKLMQKYEDVILEEIAKESKISDI